MRPRPNHGVEMNRHQPPRLPGTVGSFTLGTQIDILGRVAVTHSRR